MSFFCFPKICGRDHLKIWELITAFRFSFTVFLGAGGLPFGLVDALVAGAVVRFALVCAVNVGLGGRRLAFALVVVVAVLLLVVGASVEGGTTEGGDGLSATGLKDETPPPLVRREGSPPRAVRVDFFTGDLLVSDAGVRREAAPRFDLFEPPPLVVYESCTRRSGESAPAAATVAAATAAPSPEREGAGVDSGSMAITA